MHNKYNEELLISFFQELADILRLPPVQSVSDIDALMFTLRHIAQDHTDRTQGPDGYR